MKFLVSKATPLSLSQAVAGSAPMKRKMWRIGFLGFFAGHDCCASARAPAAFSRLP